jgi:hypothetical protein
MTGVLADGLAEVVRDRFGEPAAPVYAEVGVPRSLLGEGLVLIDTPPVGAEGPDLRTLATYTRADLVVLACESGRELSGGEVNLLTDLARLYPGLVLALTKIDFFPRWRETLASNRRLLADAGVPATIVPVSSALRLRAVGSSDARLNAESGFPGLVAHLRGAVAAKPDALAPATVQLVARLVVEALAAPLREDLDRERGGGSSDAMARLHDAQRRVDALRRTAARWQNCLSDEVADLMSDIEQDLRDRTRAVLAKVEETFDEADPARVWDTFDPWLRQALREAAEASFAWLVERTEWLAGRVAAQFPSDAVRGLPQWTLTVPDRVADKVAALDTPRIERFTPSQKLFTGLRGSYGGVLMFGLATTMTGMPLINPISIGAGAVFGGKSIRDESRSLLRRRQAIAKAAVQRHVDEVFVRLNKEAKDSIRRVQRVLRDYFGAVTEDLQESIVESLRSAKQAADSDAAARERRIRRIQRDLGRLAELYEDVQALAGPPGIGQLPAGQRSAAIPAPRVPST